MGLPAPARGQGFQGLPLKLTLPSFSGATPFMEDVLRYTCQLSARIRPMQPMHVRVPRSATVRKGDQIDRDIGPLHCILTGRPVIALAFNDMVMNVQTPIQHCRRNAQEDPRHRHVSAVACT